MNQGQDVGWPSLLRMAGSGNQCLQLTGGLAEPHHSPLYTPGSSLTVSGCRQPWGWSASMTQADYQLMHGLDSHEMQA